MTDDINFFVLVVTIHLLMRINLLKQDLADAVSAEEVARYLDLKKLDERAYTFLAVSSYDGWVIHLYQYHTLELYFSRLVIVEDHCIKQFSEKVLLIMV